MDRKNLLLRRRIARLVAGAVHRHQAETGDRLEDVAEAVGVSTGHLSNIMKAERDAPLPADLVVRLSRDLEDRSVIAGLCELCGGEFVAAGPADGAPRRELLEAAGEAARAGAGVVAEFLQALGDGVVSAEELEGLELSAPAAAAAISGLVGLARAAQATASRGRFAGQGGRAATMAEADPPSRGASEGAPLARAKKEGAR